MGKMLIVTNMYPSKKYPHYGVFVQHCAEILEKANNSVDVIKIEKTNNKLKKLVSYTNLVIRTFLSGVFGKYDVIYGHYSSHVALPICLVKKLNKKCPVVINVHGNDIIPECESEEKNMQRSRKILLKSNLVIAPSEYYRQVLLVTYHIKPEKIVVYPSGGVDIKHFCRLDRYEATLHLNIESQYRYIGYVSRIEEKKGWDIFLQACASVIKRNSDIRLIVVGDGAQKINYDAMAEALGIADKIVYYPLLSQAELVYIYNAMELFVFPTYRQSESLGLVGLEAMACECVVLGPDKYGPASYLQDGINSFTFKTGSYSDAQKKIEMIIKNKGKYDGLRKNARETARQYSTEKTDKILIEAFNGLSAKVVKDTIKKETEHEK